MYPLQGIWIGAIPIFFIVGVVKVLNLPQIGFLSQVPCGYSKGASSTTSVVISGVSDYQICQPVRTGSCLIFSGIFLLWSASFFFTPRLPEAQKEYLEHSSSAHLQEDGIFSKFFARALRLILNWKRMHMFFMLLLMCLPIMVIFYLSYSAMFGNYTVYYVVGYTITMLIADLLFVKAAREKFGYAALNVLTDVSFFLATFSAVDLNAFVLSFLYGQFFIIAQRLVVELILNYMYEQGIPEFTTWVKSRQFVWTLTLWVKNLTRRVRHRPAAATATVPEAKEAAQANIVEGDSKLLFFSKSKISNRDKVHQFKALDQSIDQVMGVAARSSSLVFAPFAVIMMWIFAKETQFLASYRLRYSAMPTYLLFSFMMVPFQVTLEMVINHAFDSSRSMKIFDYMYLSMWRWKNRLTRWMLDDTRLDQTFGESSQALHHLGFSPQFYFIVAYGVAGGIFITFGITCWIVNGIPGFLDPALLVFVVIMFLAQRIADAITRWLVFYAVWAPADRAPEKAFVQSIALGLKQRDLEQHQVAFRDAFFKQHKQWVIENLEKVYTPRGVAKYRYQLSEMYQKVVNLSIPFLYSAPALPPPAPLLETPSDDSPDDFERLMNAPRAKNLPAPSAAADSVSAITQSLVQGWFEVARKRVRKARMERATIDTRRMEEQSDEVFPDWLVVTLSQTTKDVMMRWLRKARDDVNSRS